MFKSAYPTHFFAWLLAVSKQWKIELGGGLVLIALQIYERFSEHNVPVDRYVLILVAIGIIGMYSSWRDERDRYNALTWETKGRERALQDDNEALAAQLEQARQDRTPLITGAIKEFDFVPLSSGKAPSAPNPFPLIPSDDILGTHACLIVGMTNEGPAIILINAMLTVQIDGGPWYCSGYPIKWDVNQLGGKPSDIFRSADVGKDLYSCLTDNKEKLKKNEYLEGYFVFQFPGLIPRPMSFGEPFVTKAKLILIDAGGNTHWVNAFSRIPRERISF